MVSPSISVPKDKYDMQEKQRCLILFFLSISDFLCPFPSCFSSLPPPPALLISIHLYHLVDSIWPDPDQLTCVRSWSGPTLAPEFFSNTKLRKWRNQNNLREISKLNFPLLLGYQDPDVLGLFILKYFFMVEMSYLHPLISLRIYFLLY